MRKLPRLVRLSNVDPKVLSKIESALIKELITRYRPTLRRRLAYSLLVFRKGVPELAMRIGEDLYYIYNDPLERYIIASAICRSFILALMSRAFGIAPETVNEFIKNMDVLATNYLYELGVLNGLIKESKDDNKMNL